jgi:predicted phosphodiesterase
MAKVFVISDTHFPYHSKKAYNQMMKLLKLHKPTHIIQIGDALDQYVFSKYSRSLRISPDEDISKGIDCLKKMWRDIKKACPRAICYQLMGNHDQRLSKRIAEKIPELDEFFNHKDLYKLDGVNVLDSERDYLEVDGIIYVHGWLTKSIDHAKHFNKPTVHGHRHQPGIETFGNIWSMDVGYLADADQLPLQYTNSKLVKWKLACGLVDNKQPQLFFLDK